VKVLEEEAFIFLAFQGGDISKTFGQRRPVEQKVLAQVERPCAEGALISILVRQKKTKDSPLAMGIRSRREKLFGENKKVKGESKEAPGAPHREVRFPFGS